MIEVESGEHCDECDFQAKNVKGLAIHKGTKHKGGGQTKRPKGSAEEKEEDVEVKKEHRLEDVTPKKAKGSVKAKATSQKGGGGTPKSGGTPKKVKGVISDAKEKEEEEEDFLEPGKKWSVGTKLEAEMMDPMFPNYTDTIHPVEVVAALPGAKYRCKLLAFGPKAIDIWPSALLHEPMGSQKGLTWNLSDKVHIRIRNRKVGKKR